MTHTDEKTIFEVAHALALSGKRASARMWPKVVRDFDENMSACQLPPRPYSGKELNYMWSKFKRTNRLSDVWVYHQRCGDVYRVLRNGKRHKAIVARYEGAPSTPVDEGSCSVCWALKNHQDADYDQIASVVNDYMWQCSDDAQPNREEGRIEKPLRTIGDLLARTAFYAWLYDKR